MTPELSIFYLNRAHIADNEPEGISTQFSGFFSISPYRVEGLKTRTQDKGHTLLYAEKKTFKVGQFLLLECFPSNVPPIEGALFFVH